MEIQGHTFVIVGAGMAGARAAITLRKDGFDGRLLLIGTEPDAPYERPPLSKGYLRGEQQPAEIAIRPKDQDWLDIGVELRTGTTVTRIDRAAGAVELDDGTSVGFDRLLLATGSEPRRLDLPGSDLDGVLQLRTRQDADRIRDAVRSNGRIVVIGGGWIGAEVAACSRQLGAEVTLLTGRSPLLQGPLGTEVASVYADLHRARGVDLRQGARSVAIDGDGGHVTAVRTDDGTRHPASVVVVGVGAAPRVGLALDAGLSVDGGVRVDPLFRTSDERIWAVGDIAIMRHPTLHREVRLDHWAAAWYGGPAAAKSMLDAGAPYERVPYLYSDQFDLSMEAWGVPPTWDQVVIRRTGGDAFVAAWLARGVVVGTMLGNAPDARKPLEALVRTQVRVDAERFADASVPLETLIAPG